MKATYPHPLPDELTLHATSILGDRGRAWLADVPGIVDELSTIWDVEVEEPIPAGEFNFVAPATRIDGVGAVMKIAPPYPDDEYISEADFLGHRAGRGAVRLLERDHERRAMLLERAMPGKNLAELFTGDESRAIEPAIEVLRSILDEPPSTYQPKTLDIWFAGMRRAERTGFSGAYVTKAYEIYERLSRQLDRTFYLHGDFHPGNVVSSGESYLAIDPKGIVGHVGYDIAVFLNNYHWWQEKASDIEERLDHAVREFAHAFQIDSRELREWAFAQMVLGAWWSFDDMPQLYEHKTLAKADVWNV